MKHEARISKHETNSKYKRKLKIGFIGLGLMGNPLAKNLLKAGFPLFVYNRTKSKTEEFKNLGVTVYNSPAKLAGNVDVVITMVTAPKDVRQVLLGRNSVAEGSAPGLIVIDMSTIGPMAAKELAEDLKVFKIDFLDAPVGGSVAWAEKGELTVMVGGEKPVFEKVKGVLEVMGKVFYIGKAGSGQGVKLINNLLGGISVAALAEGMVLADTLGLPRQIVIDILSDVSVVSPAMKSKMTLMVKGHYPTAFSIFNIDKDLNLALKETKGRKLPLLKNAEKLYRTGIKKGFGSLDYSAVLKVLDDKNADL